MITGSLNIERAMQHQFEECYRLNVSQRNLPVYLLCAETYDFSGELVREIGDVLTYGLIYQHYQAQQRCGDEH